MNIEKPIVSDIRLAFHKCYKEKDAYLIDNQAEGAVTSVYRNEAWNAYRFLT